MLNIQHSGQTRLLADIRSLGMCHTMGNMLCTVQSVPSVLRIPCNVPGIDRDNHDHLHRLYTGCMCSLLRPPIVRPDLDLDIDHTHMAHGREPQA
jgi:hypothetical protein